MANYDPKYLKLLSIVKLKKQTNHTSAVICRMRDNPSPEKLHKLGTQK